MAYLTSDQDRATYSRRAGSLKELAGVVDDFLDGVGEHEEAHVSIYHQVEHIREMSGKVLRTAHHWDASIDVVAL